MRTTVYKLAFALVILQRHFEAMRTSGLVGGSGTFERWPDAGVTIGTTAAA
jgi:hypothetical protein